MEHEIKRERIVDPVSERRAAGKGFGTPRRITDRQIRKALRRVR